MCYNKMLDDERRDAGPMTPKEERALAECRAWQEKLRQEKLAHEGTWNIMRRYDEMLKTVCAVLDVLREVLHPPR